MVKHLNVSNISQVKRGKKREREKEREREREKKTSDQWTITGFKQSKTNGLLGRKQESGYFVKIIIKSIEINSQANGQAKEEKAGFGEKRNKNEYKD